MACLSVLAQLYYTELIVASRDRCSHHYFIVMRYPKYLDRFNEAHITEVAYRLISPDVLEYRDGHGSKRSPYFHHCGKILSVYLLYYS